MEEKKYGLFKTQNFPIGVEKKTIDHIIHKASLEYLIDKKDLDYMYPGGDKKSSNYFLIVDYISHR